MKYEKLSKRALGCMYAATWIGIIIIGGIVAAANFIFFIPEELQIGQTICWCVLGVILIIGIFCFSSVLLLLFSCRLCRPALIRTSYAKTGLQGLIFLFSAECPASCLLTAACIGPANVNAVRLTAAVIVVYAFFSFTADIDTF